MSRFNKNQYTSIANMGHMNESLVNNPITYCMNDIENSMFLHGSNNLIQGGQNSANGQLFMSEYCSQGWDNYCELASKNNQKNVANIMELSNDNSYKNLNAGEILIRNTASRKYLDTMIAGEKVFEPFDPNVPNSPMISKWVWKPNVDGSIMKPIYSVNPETIDNDEVMNKILLKPKIAFDILLNIYQTMKQRGRLHELKNTKLGNFYLVNKKFFQ